MKKLSERKEIGKAINFGEYPVIKIDLAEKDDFGIKGTKVRFDIGKDYYARGFIRAYKDKGVLVTYLNSTMIKNGYSYNDYLEDIEYANAPIIKEKQEILICLYDSSSKLVFNPVLIYTGDKMDRFCLEPLKLEEYKVI